MLPCGKLNIPEEQVAAIINASDKMLCFPSELHPLSVHLVKRIFAEYYLFSSGADQKPLLSNEISQAIEFIKNHIGEEISVSALADSLYLSHNGLIYKFKNELNTTPSEYIAS